MKIGEKRTITGGPFKEFEAEIIAQLDTEKYRVKIVIFGKSREIEVSAQMLETNNKVAGIRDKEKASREWWNQIADRES